MRPPPCLLTLASPHKTQALYMPKGYNSLYLLPAGGCPWAQLCARHRRRPPLRGRIWGRPAQALGLSFWPRKPRCCFFFFLFFSWRKKNGVFSQRASEGTWFVEYKKGSKMATVQGASWVGTGRGSRGGTGRGWRVREEGWAPAGCIPLALPAPDTVRCSWGSRAGLCKVGNHSGGSMPGPEGALGEPSVQHPGQGSRPTPPQGYA